MKMLRNALVLVCAMSSQTSFADVQVLDGNVGDQSGLLATLYSVKTDLRLSLATNAEGNYRLTEGLLNTHNRVSRLENQYLLVTAAWSNPLNTTVASFTTSLASERATVRRALTDLRRSIKTVDALYDTNCAAHAAQLRGVLKQVQHAWVAHAEDSETLIGTYTSLANISNGPNGFYVSGAWLASIRLTIHTSQTAQVEYTEQSRVADLAFETSLMSLRRCLDLN